MVDCNDLEPGAYVPVECRPIRVSTTPPPATGLPGTWITHRPAAWGRRWEAARNSGTARLLVLSDSLGVGQNAASGWFTHGYIGLLRSSLQEIHGDGGSGFIHPGYRTASGNPGGGQVISTGAWTDVTSEGGVNGLSVRPTAAGNGATMTFPVRGTIIDIYVRRDSTFGSVTYAIDGGAPVTIPLNVAASNHVVTVTGLAPGDHTVVITANSGQSRVVGVRGRNTAGILVDNASMSGRRIDQLDDPTGVAGSLIAGTEMINDTLAAFGAPDLVIIGLGPNDALNATSHASLATIPPALDKAFSRIVAAGPTPATPPDLLVVIEHVGTADVVPAFGLTTYEYAAVVQNLYGFARAVGAAVVDNWAQGRQTRAYFDSLGYYASGEGVHLNDAGHQATAGPVIALVA